MGDRMKQFTVCVVAFLGLFLAGRAHGAGNPVGKIVEVRNDVQITRLSGQTIAAKNGSALFPGDALVTGKKSAAGFTLGEDGYFRLGEMSEVAIDELSELEGEEAEKPVLQQALGYLHSVIRGAGGKPRSVVHTATVVAGVRGTAFETIVSLGGETAVVVDEGAVALDTDTDARILNAGEMTELDASTGSVTATPAPPKTERDWNRWRGMRKAELIPKIPGTLALYRQRVEKWTGRYNEMLAGVRADQQRVADAVRAVKTARRGRPAEDVRTAVDALKVRMDRLRATLKDARRRMNRFKTIGRQVRKVGVFSWRHRTAFDDDARETIASHLAFFKSTDKTLKADTRYLIRDLRKTMRQARRILRQAERQKPRIDRKHRRGA